MTALRIGSMWFDNRPPVDATLTAKIMGGLEYYNSKYDIPADCVVINAAQAALEKIIPEIPGVEIKTSCYILPNHFFIGKAEPE